MITKLYEFMHSCGPELSHDERMEYIHNKLSGVLKDADSNDYNVSVTKLSENDSQTTYNVLVYKKES